MLFYNFNLDNPKNTLNVRDIFGTTPGSKNYYANFRYNNKERFDTKDIEGSKGRFEKKGNNY